jgi:hypothetical protein
MAKTIEPTALTYYALVSYRSRRRGELRVEMSSTDRVAVLSEMESLTVKLNKHWKDINEYSFFRLVPHDGTQAAINAGLEAILVNKDYTVIKETPVGIDGFRVMLIKRWDRWSTEDVRGEYTGKDGFAFFDTSIRGPARIKEMCRIWRDGFDAGFNRATSNRIDAILDRHHSNA